MKKLIPIFFICLLLFQTTYTSAENNNDMYFFDDCTDFSKIHQKSNQLVAEPGGGNMQGDETVIQKSVDENNLWLEYKIEYCGDLTVTTYFWNQEPIYDFSFSAKDILNEEVSLCVSKEVCQVEGYWDKVIYHIQPSAGMIFYFKIHFPDTKGIATSWAQALGSVAAHKSQPMEYYSKIIGDSIVSLPFAGDTLQKYEAYSYDQAGNKWTDLQLRVTFLPEGITFDENILKISSSAKENESVLLEAFDNDSNIVNTLRVVLKHLISGDVNTDGIVNDDDFHLACEGYLTEQTDTDWQIYFLADINRNGKIDIYDISYISKMSVPKSE